jgi:hypothetical protein
MMASNKGELGRESNVARRTEEYPVRFFDAFM